MPEFSGKITDCVYTFYLTFIALIFVFFFVTGRQVDFTDCSQLPLNVTFGDSTVFERVQGTVFQCIQVLE